MKTTKFLSVSVHDLVKGFIVSVLTVIVTGLYTSLEGGVLPTPDELKKLALVGLASGIGYILKNLLTNSADQFGKPEPKKTE